MATGQKNLIDDFAAVGDGVADDTVPLQNALNDASSNKNELFIPKGTYRITALLNISSNVRVRGAGQASIIKADAAFAGTAALRLAANPTNDVSLKDFKLDMNGVAHLGIQIGNAGPSNRVLLDNVHVTNSTSEGIRGTSGGSEITIQNCRITNHVRGIRINFGTASTDIKILNNYVDTCTQWGIQFDHNTGQTDLYTGVQIIGNTVHGTVGDTAPIEPAGCTDIVISGNRIDGGSRGVSTANLRNFSISDNVISNQSTYAVEINGGIRGVISNNVADATTRLVSFTAAIGVDIHQDIKVSGNLVTNSTLPGATDAVIDFGVAQANRITISDNQFEGITEAGVGNQIIKTGNNAASSDIVIQDNVYIIDAVDSVTRFVYALWAARTRVYRNHILVTRNAPVGRNDYVVFIHPTGSAIPPDLEIVENRMHMTGTNSASQYRPWNLLTSIPGLYISGNRITGNFDR